MGFVYLIVAMLFMVGLVIAWLKLLFGHEDSLPGGLDNPWQQVDISEVSFKRERAHLVVSVALQSQSEKRCLQIGSKKSGEDMTVIIEHADPPGLESLMYTLTDSNGRYYCKLKIPAGTKRILYGENQEPVC